MSTIHGFWCATCGQYHDGLPMDFGADFPDVWYFIPSDEREQRCEWASDWCITDNKHFYVRGCLEIPVLDGSRPFVWGIWTSLSEQNFRRTLAVWNTEGREQEPAYFGWFSTSLPGYPETLNLKTLVHTRPIGQRPYVELEPTDHPLAIEQRNGITMARVQEIAEILLHGHDAAEQG